MGLVYYYLGFGYIEPIYQIGVPDSGPDCGTGTPSGSTFTSSQ